jgi:hypothetical protein
MGTLENRVVVETGGRPGMRQAERGWSHLAPERHSARRAGVHEEIRNGRRPYFAVKLVMGRTPAEAEGQPEQARRAERERELTDHRKAIEGRLPAMLRGAARPHDRDEALEIGRLCRDRRCYAAGARPFESALREDHGLDGDGVSPHRYDSACLANLAGCTTGAGDPPPDAAGRTRFRGLAHPPRKY